MQPDDLVLLTHLPDWAFAGMLVLARTSTTVMLLPGFGEAAVPARLRIGIALALTLLLLPGLAPLLPAPPDGFLPMVGMLAGELLTGLWLGWLARLLVLALPIAGGIISYMIGLANVLQSDVEGGRQVAEVDRLLEVGAPVLLLATGLYTLPLTALAGSYQVIVPGTWLPAGDVAQTVAHQVAISIELAFRLTTPFVLANLVFQVAISLLSRLVPSLQIFLVVMPGQILGGLLLFALLAGTMVAAWSDALRAGLMQLPGLR